jgi:hypothetical protein
MNNEGASMEYDKVIYKLGSLYSMLRELEAAGLYQGEHTIAYADANGVQRTVHVYIDGTEIQMCDTADATDWRFSVDVSSDD